MRLLHLSDTHLVRSGKPPAHPELPTPDERLATVLAAVIGNGPFDAVLLTGDICDDGSAEGARRVRTLIEAVLPEVPIIAVPGNHDLGHQVRLVFDEPPARLGAWRVVTVATNLPWTVEGHAQPVVEALEGVDGSSPALLVLHHPLRSRSTHEWFVLRDAALLDERLAAHPGPIVLASGHTHEAFEATEGSVRHLGAPSTYYAITHAGEHWAPVEGGTGARIIDLHDDGSLTTELVFA